MEYKNVKCDECGHRFQIASHIKSYGCNECGHIHTQAAINSPVSSVPSDQTLPNEPKSADSLDVDRIGEAEQYCLQAEFILHSLQANISVYGNNSVWSGANPADVDLALKYINRSLEIWPDNPKYLNLKALFLMEGKGDREGGIALLERAAALNPTDITIQDNLEKSKAQSQQCFVATAAYGGPQEKHVGTLRDWRDHWLSRFAPGRWFIGLYYRNSPPLARWVERTPANKALARLILAPLIFVIVPMTNAVRPRSDKHR